MKASYFWKAFVIILFSLSLITFPLITYSYDDSDYSYESPDNSSYQSNDNDIGGRVIYASPTNDSSYDEDNNRSYYRENYRQEASNKKHRARLQINDEDAYSRMPNRISGIGEKVIIVNPNVHAWGAYTAEGILVHAGIATAGGDWCRDIGRSCRTKVGSFRIISLGGPGCVSSKFPVGEGGAPMPYCMFFNGGQALHGSYNVVDGNESHGCVRLFVDDAEWLRYNFATVGTRVIIRPY